MTDIGIAVGSVKVASINRLAFLKKSDGMITREQDPDNHYWIYFTTAKGEEVILDCGMFPSDITEVVDTEPYLPPGMPALSRVTIGNAPIFFIDCSLRKTTRASELHTERKRVSMLRNPNIQAAVGVLVKTYRGRVVEQVTDAELRPFYDYMETLSGGVGGH